MPLTDPTEDLTLLAEMRCGNAVAFERLYRRHQGSLYRFALLRCGSADAAADIVQEIFLALLNNTLKFDPARGVLQGFLFGVARNLLLKQHEAGRRTVSTNRIPDNDDIDEDIADSAVGPLEQLLANESAESVRTALLQIPPHYRDVLILYEMHDLTYVDIAQVCGIDVGTVRSRLSRARARLHSLLRDQLEPRSPTSAAIASAEPLPHSQFTNEARS